MKNLSFNKSKNLYKDISFNYNKEREKELDIFEPGEGNSTSLNPLDFQQPWNTDMLKRPYIDKKDKEEESLNSDIRDGLQLWI